MELMEKFVLVLCSAVAIAITIDWLLKYRDSKRKPTSCCPPRVPPTDVESFARAFTDSMQQIIAQVQVGHKTALENSEKHADAFKSLAEKWSEHAMAHTEMDLDKFALIVDGTRADIGDVNPRSTFIPGRRPSQAPASDGMTATFVEPASDSIG